MFVYVHLSLLCNYFGSVKFRTLIGFLPIMNSTWILNYKVCQKEPSLYGSYNSREKN